MATLDPEEGGRISLQGHRNGVSCVSSIVRYPGSHGDLFSNKVSKPTSPATHNTIPWPASPGRSLDPIQRTDMRGHPPRSLLYILALPSPFGGQAMAMNLLVVVAAARTASFRRPTKDVMSVTTTAGNRAASRQ